MENDKLKTLTDLVNDTLNQYKEIIKHSKNIQPRSRLIFADPLDWKMNEIKRDLLKHAKESQTKLETILYRIQEMENLLKEEEIKK